MPKQFEWLDDVCECGKPVTHKDNVGYVHVSTGYIQCIPGRPEEAMTEKLRKHIEELNARHER